MEPGLPIVRVRGLTAANRAFARLGPNMKFVLREALSRAADPVAEDAASYAYTRIDNMHLSPRWARMRVGTTLSLVYVAPASRRRGGSPRPNLAGLLMDRSMEPALTRNVPRILTAAEAAISIVAAAFNSNSGG